MIHRSLNINGWWALFYKDDIDPRVIFPTEKDCQNYLEKQSCHNTEDFRTFEIRQYENGVAEFTGCSTSIPKIYLLRKSALREFNLSKSNKNMKYDK